MMIVAVVFGKFIRKLSKRTQDEIAESNAQVQETLSGIVNVKSFTTEIFESLKYNGTVEKVRQIAMRSAIWRGLFGAFIIIFLFGSIAVVIWRGAVLMEKGELDAALFFSFLLYTVMIGASFGGIASQYASIQKALGSIEAVLDIMEIQAEEIPVQSNSISTPRLKGLISFKRVSFSYASRPDEKVISDLDIEILPGEKLALVGPSGAGKSTLASLLLGFYNPTEGQILIDDKSVDEIGLSILRANMAYVPQEVMLFSGTVKENIKYGSSEASDEDVLKAAKDAQVTEFIDRFDSGMDTLIGDRGIQLSGGQKQRLAIARALLKDPAILILDEATSALDSSSEKLVQKALENLMKGRTSVIIAHRLSTIRDADRIVVLEGGRKVEEGKHSDLITHDEGLYKRLSELQFNE
jgi:ABC-type multidrug transport system fused ATPase/permease subunit